MGLLINLGDHIIINYGRGNEKASCAPETISGFGPHGLVEIDDWTRRSGPIVDFRVQSSISTRPSGQNPISFQGRAMLSRYLVH